MHSSKKLQFDFPYMQYAKYSLIFSGIFLIIGFAVIAFKGFRYGIDFSGGSQLEVMFPGKITVFELEQKLPKGVKIKKIVKPGKTSVFLIQKSYVQTDSLGIQKQLKSKIIPILLKNFSSLKFNSKIIDDRIEITVAQTKQIFDKKNVAQRLQKIFPGKIQKDELVAWSFPNPHLSLRFGAMEFLTEFEISNVLQKQYPDFSILSRTVYEPTQGVAMKKQAGWLSILVLIIILLYLSLRFELKFALSAIIALLHDVFIVLSTLAMFQIFLDMSAIIALLSIIGYSLNDTIILFDRIRENLKDSVLTPQSTKLINQSITQSFSRTIITSLTTLFVVMCIFTLGGQSLKTLSFTLMIGILAGTYSSIFIASPILLKFSNYVRFRKTNALVEPF